MLVEPARQNPTVKPQNSKSLREDITMELTRRHLLAGAVALAAAPALPAVPARAAAPMADKQAPSFYRYKIGDAQVNAVFDGTTTFDLTDSFVLNARKDEVNAALD